MDKNSKATQQDWFVYIVECRDGRLYTGITTDLVRRFHQHGSGKGAKFTRRNPPVRMLAAQPCANRSEASKLEYQIKQYSVVNKRLAAMQWEITGLAVAIP